MKRLQPPLSSIVNTYKRSHLTAHVPIYKLFWKACVTPTQGVTERKRFPHTIKKHVLID